MPVKYHPLPISPSGGTPNVTSGAIAVRPNITSGTGIATLKFPAINFIPEQILGFIPLKDCSESECRSFQGDCYINPVFGDVSANGPTYENDFSTFLISDTMQRPGTQFIIQKLDRNFNTWSDSFTMSGTYGTVFAIYPTYLGFQLNWGRVLYGFGAGFYRIKVSLFNIDSCMISEVLHLLPFNCKTATRTVKFEAYQSGKIGSVDSDGLIYDLSGKRAAAVTTSNSQSFVTDYQINWYDSIRVPGFFGYETTTYDEIMLEYPSGLMERVRDEAIQKFKFHSNLLPKYIHDRLKAYGLMADKLLVSDYNENNSDYSIKQKPIVKDGGYDPKYHIKNRLSSVVVNFKEGIESVIKNIY